MVKEKELKLSDIVRKYSSNLPTLQFKAGENTEVKLWFDVYKVLDFFNSFLKLSQIFHILFF